MYEKTGNAGSNALTTINKVGGGSSAFTYDKNGNQTAGDGRSLVYTSFNMPKTITKGSTTSNYSYGSGRERILKVSSNATKTTTIRYLGKAYEQVSTSSDSVIEHKHYIPAGGTTVLYTQRSSNINDTRYMHQDHIGSVDAITNEAGQVIERASFDAWGERRNPNWTTAAASILSLTTRGFTGHEHDDDIGLINMNARMYDPNTGRFLQPDTFVQFWNHTQGLNRFAYVRNNPLSAIDPSGLFEHETDGPEGIHPDDYV